MVETDAAQAMYKLEVPDRERSRVITKNKNDGRRQQENGLMVKTGIKRKSDSEHSDNVRKTTVLEKPCSTKIMKEDTSEVVAGTCSKPKEGSDNVLCVRQVRVKKPDGKMKCISITIKGIGPAKPSCDEVLRRTDVTEPDCELKSTQDVKAPAKPSCDEVLGRTDLIEPGCELKSTHEVKAPPKTSCDKVLGRRDMIERGCQLKSTQDEPKESVASVPNLEEIKKKLQDSYSKATKRRTTKLLDYKILPKPSQGCCQRIEKRTTNMKRSILKTAPPSF